MTRVKLFQADSLEDLQYQIDEWSSKENAYITSVSNITIESYGVDHFYICSVLYTSSTAVPLNS